MVDILWWIDEPFWKKLFFFGIVGGIYILIDLILDRKRYEKILEKMESE